MDMTKTVEKLNKANLEYSQAFSKFSEILTRYNSATDNDTIKAELDNQIKVLRERVDRINVELSNLGYEPIEIKGGKSRRRKNNKKRRTNKKRK